MANEDVKVNVVAAVRRSSGTNFECVIRWVLGTGDQLPREDDRFDLAISTVDQQGARTTIATTTVRPRLYAMLDPPREERPVQYAGAAGVRWLVAVRPTEPIDCDAANSGKLDGKAFGVCHLLKETEPSRVAWRASNIIHRAISARPPAASALAAVAKSPDSERLAKAFGRALVELDIRPLDLPRHLRIAFAEMTQQAQQHGALDAARIAPLLRLDGADAGLQFAHAALVMHALADRGTLETLDATVNGATQTRKHLRIRTLHGGDMIDYWADPDNAGGPIDERDRGKQYPASELIGSGCRIEFAASDVRRWVDERLSLLIEIIHQAQSSGADRDRPLGSSIPGNIPVGIERDEYEPGAWSLDYTYLKRALVQGSSHPPPPPVDASVDYAMFQGDAAARASFPEAKGPTLNFATGDGRVEIRIDSPRQDQGRATVSAFNVYGMWENDETRPYFADPTRNPSLKDLGPWLITRRYSFERDLWEAFPNVGAPRHPGLLAALATPPPQPVLRRADRVSDRTDGEDDTLPNFGPEGGAVFAFDIRKGMRSGAAAPDLFAGWDPAAAAATDWSPELRRDGTPVASGAPQAYRLWVTSLDAFDQESEPVPVRTNDIDAGQAEPNYIFSPVRRTPLFGPPGTSEAESTKFELSFDAATQMLSLEFETPWENQVGGRMDPDNPGTRRRVDARHLEATVAVWRRRLTRPVDDSRRLDALKRAGTALPELPQWDDAHGSLTREGWRLVAVTTVSAPAAGDVWRLSMPLADQHLGWEYIAGVNFQVNKGFAAFYAPNVLQSGPGTGRLAHLAQRLPDGTYNSVPHRVAETPRASDVALTRALALPNPHMARAPDMDIDTIRAWPAKPVLPPPGVRRDLVLLRLVSQGVSRGATPVDPQEWRDTGVALTLGQAVMCDAAIERTAVGANPLPPDADELESVRQILARAFTVTGALGQHPTLGFRGFLDLRWTYTPLEVKPPAAQEAEAVHFRVYSVRVAQEANAAANFATVVAEGRQSGNGYVLTSITKGYPNGWKSITDLGQPALARIVASDGTTTTGDLIAAGESGGQRYVRITPQGGAAAPLPVTATIYLYVAQPLAEIPVSSFEEARDYRMLLPIGGGEPEIFGWWVVGVSAQGRESSTQLRRGVLRDFGSTLEPPTPVEFQVSSPTDFTKHVLEFPKFRFWLPGDIARPEDPKYFPRLVLTWQPLHSSLQAGLIVEREERQIAKPAPGARHHATPTPWAAIKAIELAPEGTHIEAVNIEAIRDNWLLGEPVDVEGPILQSYEHIGRDPSRRLDATTGLKDVPHPAKPGETRPAFIDYYGRNTDRHGDPDRQSVMDGNWEFRYRLRSFLDLGEKIPDSWRYLLSSPTEWSSWTPPETPPLTLHERPPILAEDPTLMAPRVQLRIVPGQIPTALRASLLRNAADHHRWEYRVIVRRRLDMARPNTGGVVEPVWIDIGAPIALSETSEFVVDDEVDRAWPSHVPTFRYRVTAQQFLILSTADGEVERLVRGFEGKNGTIEFDLSLTLPRSSGSEVEITKTIYVA